MVIDTGSRGSGCDPDRAFKDIRNEALLGVIQIQQDPDLLPRRIIPQIDHIPAAPGRSLPVDRGDRIRRNVFADSAEGKDILEDPPSGEHLSDQLLADDREILRLDDPGADHELGVMRKFPVPFPQGKQLRDRDSGCTDPVISSLPGTHSLCPHQLLPAENTEIFHDIDGIRDSDILIFKHKKSPVELELHADYRQREELIIFQGLEEDCLLPLRDFPLFKIELHRDTLRPQEEIDGVKDDIQHYKDERYPQNQHSPAPCLYFPKSSVGTGTLSTISRRMVSWVIVCL